MLLISGMSPKSEAAEVEDNNADSSAVTAETSAVERVAVVGVPPGGRKRDTMIRELKSKLKEKFPTNTLASTVAVLAVDSQRVTKPQFRWKGLGGIPL